MLPSTVKALRDHGLSDKAIIEIVGVIGLYTFLNSVKHLMEPALDFPEVEEFHPKALGSNAVSACAKTIAHPIFWKLPPPGAASRLDNTSYFCESRAKRGSHKNSCGLLK
jgi:hypothetical protein